VISLFRQSSRYITQNILFLPRHHFGPALSPVNEKRIEFKPWTILVLVAYPIKYSFPFWPLSFPAGLVFSFSVLERNLTSLPPFHHGFLSLSPIFHLYHMLNLWEGTPPILRLELLTHISSPFVFDSLLQDPSSLFQVVFRRDAELRFFPVAHAGLARLTLRCVFSDIPGSANPSSTPPFSSRGLSLSPSSQIVFFCFGFDAASLAALFASRLNRLLRLVTAWPSTFSPFRLVRQHKVFRQSLSCPVILLFFR